MVDVHTPEQRSKNMSAIKAKNTKPEIQLRKLLWSSGLRYRLKNKLPGKPDLVFPSKKLAIFVDGCFWHQCPSHFKMPATRTDFWDKKIKFNIARDKVVNAQLQELGWTVLRFWEHEVKQTSDKVIKTIEISVRKSL